jgi:16S rRNA processing protein RimM
MKVDDCYQLGYVIKTHGLKGEVQILLDVDDPSQYQKLESMFVLRNNSLVPFFIEHIQVIGKKAILKLEDIENIDEAKVFVSNEIYLPLALLPPIEDGGYYLHQLVGMELHDKGNAIGDVTEIYEMGPQNMISILHQGKEVLVPLIDEIIKKVDLERNVIDADLPEGLVDVFLEENEN